MLILADWIKAKERLKVLQNCNCEEFKELNNAINSGSSKY